MLGDIKDLCKFKGSVWPCRNRFLWI